MDPPATLRRKKSEFRPGTVPRDRLLVQYISSLYKNALDDRFNGESRGTLTLLFFHASLALQRKTLCQLVSFTGNAEPGPSR